MQSVPNIISTKDLSYISDMLNWNLTFKKKVDHFNNEVNDQDIKNLFSNLSQMLLNHYQKLENILK